MYLSLDTEATGLDLRHGCKPFYISTCNEEGVTRSWDWPVDPFTREPQIPEHHMREVQAYLFNKTLVFHNIKFDVRALTTVGFNFTFRADTHVTWSTVTKTIRHNITCPGWEDTLLATHALASGMDSKGLKEVAMILLDYSDRDERLLKQHVIHACNVGRSKGWKLGYNPVGRRQVLSDYWMLNLVDPDNKDLATYGDADAERTMLLWLSYKEQLEEENLLDQYKKEKNLIPVVYNMETDGFTIHDETLENKLRYLQECVDKETHTMRALAARRGFRNLNPKSGQQLRELLYTGYKLPILKLTANNHPSTDKGTIADLLENHVKPHSSREMFLESLLLSKLYQSGINYLVSYAAYAQPTEDEGFSVLYPSLNQSGAKTTRFTCSNPNGQNISKIGETEINGKRFDGPMLREVFSPPPGKVWYAIDYSQVELRVFAYASKEQSIIDALNSGADYHSFVAERMFKKPAHEITKEERRLAKAINFGIIFGAGEAKINRMAGSETAYAEFSESFPNVASFMREVIKEVRENGFLYTLDGYRLDVPRNAPYKGVNYLVQGTAGRVLKNAMVEMADPEHGVINWVSNRIVMQVHDELIIEYDEENFGDIPANLYSIMMIMEKAGADMGIITPVTCERIESDWGNGEEVIVRPDRIELVPTKEELCLQK